MSMLTLNEIRLDYITLTSFDSEFYNRAESLCNTVSEEWKHASRMQYNGKLRQGEHGTCFCGSGVQKGINHYILQIDGELCHNMRFHLFSLYPAYRVRCTRMDAQITIREPRGWSQWELLSRMKDRYGEGMVGYPRPDVKNGQLMQTVYLGRRKGSDRFMRVYVKLSDEGDRLLRLEVEIKRNRSVSMYKELCLNQWDGDFKRVVHPELMLQAQKDRGLEAAFSQYIEGNHKPVKVKTKESETANWIIDVCLPSISRHLHSHSADRKDEIESMVLKISEWIVWRQYENESE